MRWLYFALALLPLSLHAQFSYIKKPDSQVRIVSNVHDTTHSNLLTRSTDYPTQIIRITQAPVDQLDINCDQLNQVIDEMIINKITADKFVYTTYINCIYDPMTHNALKFTLHSYFDPVNDDAIAALHEYLTQYNGADFLGTQLNIESAKGMLVALNLSVGKRVAKGNHLGN